MATTEITSENIDQTITNGGIVILDFWAGWCAPCMQFGPIFEAASQKHPDIVFGKVDTEEQPDIAMQAQIQAIPTLMAFRDGVPVFRESGALPAAALDQLIEQIQGLDMDAVRAQMAQQQNDQVQ